MFAHTSRLVIIVQNVIFIEAKLLIEQRNKESCMANYRSVYTRGRQPLVRGPDPVRQAIIQPAAPLQIVVTV